MAPNTRTYFGGSGDSHDTMPGLPVPTDYATQGYMLGVQTSTALPEWKPRPEPIIDGTMEFVFDDATGDILVEG